VTDGFSEVRFIAVEMTILRGMLRSNRPLRSDIAPQLQFLNLSQATNEVLAPALVVGYHAFVERYADKLMALGYRKRFDSASG
jgi:hypothetical protein